MRLAQLARKIGVTQSQITEILNEHNMSIPSHGNTKLDDDHVQTVLKHLGIEYPLETEPTNNASELEEAEIETKAVVTEQEEVLREPEEPKPELIEDDYEKQNEEKEEEIVEDEDDKPQEVIRAKKIKLEGIKVVGKIDLPEPPQKEEKPDNEEKKIKKESRGSKKPRPAKKKETFEQKLERAKKREERRKKERERKLKQKKKQHYYKNVQPKVAAQSKKSKTKTNKKKPAKQAANQPVKEFPVYKNPIRKLWAWLTGEYDRF